MMTKRPTPRNVGGPITMESRGGTFRGFEGTSSSGQPAMGFASNIPTAMMTPDALARAQGERIFVDPMEGRYQVDPNQPGMPLMPDVVSGPWAEPGMPAPPRAEMRQDISKSLQSLDRMPGVRAAPTGRYPGQTFRDTAADAQIEDVMLRQKGTSEQALNYAGQDPFASSRSGNLSFEELRDRVALRGMMYGDDYRDRQNRDRVQQDLANRAARAPIGTPTMLPGQGSKARIQANLARQMERLSRTPQGAQFLAEQQQERDLMADRMKAASTAVPVRDPQTGQVMGYVTGTGASLPNPAREGERQLSPTEAEALGLVPISVEGQTVRYGRPNEASNSRLRFIPGTPSAVAGQPGTPDRWADESTGEMWNVGDPRPGAPKAGTAAATTDTPAATGAKSRVKALMERNRKPSTAAS
jgi:hypothetical protein